MPIREGSAHWEGSLEQGQGTLQTESGALDASLTFGSRFQEDAGTNPEELIGAAHAGCYSMVMAKLLAGAGHTPEAIDTRAKVTIEKSGEGFAITRIKLITRVTAPGLDESTFQEYAETGKNACPVSKALGAVDIELEATLAG